MMHFDALKIYTHMENIVRKGAVDCNKQFLLFSQCFLPNMALLFHFKCTFKCHLQSISIWTILKFCRLVMGLKKRYLLCRILVDWSNMLSLYQTTKFWTQPEKGICKWQNKCSSNEC